MFICMTADSRGQRTELRFSQYLHSHVNIQYAFHLKTIQQ